MERAVTGQDTRGKDDVLCLQRSRDQQLLGGRSCEGKKGMGRGRVKRRGDRSDGGRKQISQKPERDVRGSDVKLRHTIVRLKVETENSAGSTTEGALPTTYPALRGFTERNRG